MKVVLAMLVAFGLMGYVGHAYAADPAPAPAQKDAKKEKAVRGEVVKVDGNKLTIKGKDNKEIVVTTDDKTEVNIEGNPPAVHGVGCFCFILPAWDGVLVVDESYFRHRFGSQFKSTYSDCF